MAFLTCGLFLMSLESLQLRLHVADVKHLQQVITRGSQQPVAILVPAQVHHCVLVGVPAE